MQQVYPGRLTKKSSHSFQALMSTDETVPPSNAQKSSGKFTPFERNSTY